MTTTAPRLCARGLCAAAWLSCLLIIIPGAARASTPEPCERAVLTLVEAAELLRVDADELERLAEQKGVPARRVGASWRFNCAALMAWLTGEWESLPTGDLSAVKATGTAIVDQAETKAPPSASSSAAGQEQPVGEAPEERPAEDIFLRGQRVLLGRGDVVVDFGQFYSRSDNLQLALVDGGLGLATLEQETLTTLLVGRVGIFNETELFVGTTFLSQDTHAFLGSTNFARSRHNEFGNVSVGVRRTLMRERTGRPDIIASLDASIPTGDTSSAGGAGLVLVKSVDPVILFASAHYSHIFRPRSADPPRLQSKRRFDVSVGYGLALNDTLAVSTTFSGLFAGAATSDDATFRPPGNFGGRFGLTTRLAEGLYIEPSVSFGLNGPSDSFAFGVTMPYAF